MKKSLAVVAVILAVGTNAYAADFTALCEIGSVKASGADAERLCKCIALKIGESDMAAAIAAMVIRAAIAKGEKPDYTKLPPDFAKGIAVIGQATVRCGAEFSH